MMRLMAALVRRVLVVGLVVVAGVLGGGSVASAAVAPRIFGGSAASMADHPWQIALVRHNVASAFNGQFCGGVIVDALHVITAGHCLDFNQDGAVDPAQNFDIVAGMADLTATPGAPEQRIRLSTWGGMPQFDLTADVSPYDAALATLSQPLDTLAPGVRPAVLAGSGSPTPAGTPLSVSGWGITELPPPDDVPADLRSADIFAVGDPDCAAIFDLSPTDEATMLCAIAAGKDSCSGDSGGPLTRADSTLVGLVSWGPQECASPDGAPGVYTELAEPAINSFVRGSSDPVYAPPQSTAVPVLTGTAKSGETLSCTPGTWTSTAPGEPEIEFRFGAADGHTLQNWSQATTYVVGANDGGVRIVCDERARDASGATIAASSQSDPVIGRRRPWWSHRSSRPSHSRAPGTTTPPVTKPIDTVAPRTTFLSIRCSKARRCVVRLRVADRGATLSGVKASASRSCRCAAAAGP